MPLWLGVATTVWGSVGRDRASALVALGFGWDVGNIIAGDVTGYSGVVVGWHMAAGVGSFIAAVGLLVNLYTDSFIVSVSLPRLVRLVGAVGRWHSVSFAIGGEAIGLDDMMPVGFKRMPDDVLVGVVVKNGPPRESRDFDVVAHTRE